MISADTRVSFALLGRRALGTAVQDEARGRVLVAVDPQSMQGSQGILNVVIWIPAVSLTAVP